MEGAFSPFYLFHYGLFMMFDDYICANHGTLNQDMSLCSEAMYFLVPCTSLHLTSNSACFVVQKTCLVYFANMVVLLGWLYFPARKLSTLNRYSVYTISAKKLSISCHTRCDAFIFNPNEVTIFHFFCVLSSIFLYFRVNCPIYKKIYLM